jgi:PAS domain S-box-containing protein
MLKAEGLLNAIIDASKMGVCIVDHRNKIVEVNDLFCEIYGYDRESLLNQSYSVLKPENYRDRASLDYQNYIEGKHQQNSLRHILTKSGQRKTVYAFSAHLTDEKGHKQRAHNIIDVSDLPLGKDFSSQQEVTVGNEVKTGILRCNMDGGLLYVNAYARSLLYLSAGSDRLYHEVNYTQEGVSRKLPLIQLLNELRYLDNQEVLIERKDHAPFWALLSAATVIDAGGTVCFDITLISLEEQKLSERKLNKKIEELNTANKRLDHFVYGATHDLKAPLASLAGLIHILRREDDPAQKELFMQMMDKSINRLNEFIKEIVDYSRNANQEVRRETVDFQSLIEEIFESMAHMENASKIRQIIRVEQTDTFLSDNHRIRVVLSNLVSNAFKYSSSHRRDSYIEVNVKVENQKAIVQVRDNGLGIGKNHIEKIFDMFFRASEGQGGTGLGLYIVKETLDKLHGSVHVVSELGKGTCFVVTIPSVAALGSPNQLELGI